MVHVIGQHELIMGISTVYVWLVKTLTGAGRVDRTKLAEARLLFEQMLGYANHVGLYAEEIGGSGEALGNSGRQCFCCLI